MQAVQYSDKSFLVYGETKPWKVELQSFGGKYGPNWPAFPGHPGWIFSNKRQTEVMNFIEAANSGMSVPMPTLPAPVQMRQPVRMNIQQPVGLGNLPIIPKPSSPKMMGPTPVTVLPTIPQAVTYPNQFKAADGKTYQMIMYTVPLPVVGQKVVLKFTVQDAEIEYLVSKIKGSAPVDDIEVTRVLTVGEGDETETHTEVSRAVVMAGTWQVVGLMEAHMMTFQ